MVCDRHYVRRCINCWFDQSIHLPPLNKKIIYLDQFVISNMAKELDPDRAQVKKGDQGGFYMELFVLLDRLSKMQLIVCPDSPIQDNESVVTGPHYEKIRAVFRHLSHGIEFSDPNSIYHVRIIDALKCWLGAKAEPELDKLFALSHDPDVWNDTIRIEVNYKLPGLAEELRLNNQEATKRLHEVCRYWLGENNFEFEQAVISEMDGHGKSLLKTYANACEQRSLVLQGKAPIEHMYGMFSPAASLISRMLDILQSAGVKSEDLFPRIRQFFVSNIFRSVQAVQIAAVSWASITRQVRQVRNPSKFPRAGMYNDIDAVSLYSPFCDAMFVDKEFYHFLSQPELKRTLPRGPRFFCLQKRSKEEFLTYLREIEAAAPTNHFDVLNQVYGERFERPFVELLAYLKAQNRGKQSGELFQ